MNKKATNAPENQITFYQTADGKVNIEVLFADENIWLTQKKMAELFAVDRSVITKHLKKILSPSCILVMALVIAVIFMRR